MEGGIITVFCLFVTLIFVWRVLDYVLRLPYILSIPERYVMITGCDTGFGRAAALQLDKLGCHVIASCLTLTAADTLRKELSSRSHVIQLDVSNSESVSKAFQQVQEIIPGHSGLWGLINNAGYAGFFGPSDWLDRECYIRTFQVNVFGLQDVTRTFLPLIKKCKGRIVNTASSLGHFSPVFSSAYASSKFAVIAVSDAIRRELIHFKVTVHTIEPGGHETNLVDQQRVTDATMNSWNEVTEEKKQQYGEGYPQTLLWILFNMFSFMNSSDISGVLNAYEHALFSRRPKTCYKVGLDSYLFTLLGWLPDWFTDVQFYLLMPRPKMCPGFPTLGDLILRYKIKSK